ncbi:hypothetical protein PF005_g4607 [Phytophthora fragariae]|uniref:Uncharacterized protein n=1 Tax=Phytophthora fragariae TaxID=53985 RepID=A0A6A3Z3K9_9STRA|nr:hypothetical protein PF003_g28559 [Phytophthora fragariae]KAE8932672.1 hypothetical protein PF009_g17304 [Phytophthora fragariae]KAE9023877.1 hypothetical protein PF011_g3767 [Phytophthora fragariae]KAE9121493.1 hypothetical protein PF007_g7798 [Phytophthora fragariae]KAE9130228.1 hypothetical protein PF010_g3911 [Phytophthora fragariae]
MATLAALFQPTLLALVPGKVKSSVLLMKEDGGQPGDVSGLEAIHVCTGIAAAAAVAG